MTEPRDRAGRAAPRRRLAVTAVLTLLAVAAVPIISIWMELEFSGTSEQRAMTAEDWPLPQVPAGGRHVLLLMIDGLATGPFRRALDEARLPNLDRLLRSRPTAMLEAISTFPSATSPAVPELLSGSYVEMDGVDAPGAVHAFDRRHRAVIRYVTEPDSWQWPVPTLFDVIGDRPAVTVFEGRWDGPISILTQYNLVGQAFLEAIGAAAFSGGDRGPVEAYLQLIEGQQPPVLSLVVFNAFDMAAHFHGPDAPEALRALEGIDALIGEILDALGRDSADASRLADTSVILFGDHGITPSGRFVDLEGFFTGRGQATVDVSTVGHVLLRERLGSLWTSWTDVILVAGGSNITQIYLKDETTGWQPPARVQDAERTRRLAALAAELAALEGIAQVLWLDENDAVRVLSRDASARVLTRGAAAERTFAYLVDDDAGGDPFGYLEHPATRGLVCRHGAPADSCYHSLTAWFDASAGSLHPGAVPLLPKAFKPAQFAGDLMVAAEVGYTFLRGQRGDHGHLHRSSMITPLVLNGLQITDSPETHQPKLVDLFPSVAVLLGADPADPAFDHLDGRVLDCVAGPGAGTHGSPGGQTVR